MRIIGEKTGKAKSPLVVIKPGMFDIDRTVARRLSFEEMYIFCWICGCEDYHGECVVNCGAIFGLLRYLQLDMPAEKFYEILNRLHDFCLIGIEQRVNEETGEIDENVYTLSTTYLRSRMERERNDA